MAEQELEKISVISELSNRAVQEYEDLQRMHHTAAKERLQLEAERDEAVKKLNQFQQVSQLVLEEVSVIQQSLEVERSCRESAEALASKLKRQNRSLKRKSLMLLPLLSPETITEINLEEEEDEEEEEEEDEEEYEEKEETTFSEQHSKPDDLETVKQQLRETREELLREKQEKTLLIAERDRQRRLLGKYNRVSQFAVEEYETLQETLDLERDLRKEAENFARAMLVEQTKLKRQSQILVQTSSPSQVLQDALIQITRLTQDLETQRLEHQDQMRRMESRLQSSEAERELEALRRKLELVEEEKEEFGERCCKAEGLVKDLRFTVEELQKKLQAVTNPPPSLAPPPPPPPPPPAPGPTSNPLSSLLSLIRKRRDVTTDIPLVVQDSAKTPELDIRQQAVDEMMHRIKKGVQLRPVGQSPNRTRRQMERLPSNSAIQELKGIMENFGRTSHQPKAAPPPSASADDQLQRILLRRRGVLESQNDASVHTGRTLPPPLY